MKTRIAIAIVLVLIAISGCIKQTTTTTTTTITTIVTTSLEVPPAKNETFCVNDADCACGVHTTTGKCFYGNKRYVDVTRQCPDFCSGFAGNLRITCIDNECRQVLIATR